MESPSAQQEDLTLSELGSLGLKVMITELDVNILPSVDPTNGAEVSLRVAANPALNPYPNGLPDAVQQALAQRYADLFGVFVKHRDVVERVTFWGVNDGDSWLNNWPVRGRTNYPLLFDRAGNPKPAFARVVATASGGH
jgi:endo-1,4-beta-xylanase